MEMPNQVQTVRSVVVVENLPIVVEIFKDATGKILRQQSFTKDQLTATKAQVETQYATSIVRLNEMLALLEPVV
jgi:hypothetical protein